MGLSMTLQRLRFACLFAVLAAPWLAHAGEDEPPNPKLVPPVPLHEQVLHLAGDPGRPVDLVVTVYKPDGAGPFPLAVMNHGANGHKEKPADMPRYRYTYPAYYFLSRGYAVALPMMRGYAGSGGAQARSGCALSDMALDNGRDIAGVIAGLGADKQIDTRRVVVAGQSFGGWNTLGLGAVAPPGVKGLIDFFGGVQSSGCTAALGGESDALISGAARLGAATSVKSLWIYGDNDSLFSPDLWQPMFRAYTKAGGRAELVDIGRFMDDSHQMLSHLESIPLWAPLVYAFLARIGLPSGPIYPAYMPLPSPPPTHFAAVDNVDAVPWLTVPSRENYRVFLTKPLPRAFVVAPGGQSASATGAFDPLGRAMALCRDSHLTCTPYAVDNDVVWVPPVITPAVPASHFAAVDDVAAVPWLNAQNRPSYAHFLTLPSPRAFVLATGGESATTQGGADPMTRALALCTSHGLQCYPYALNNDVVWVPPLPPAPRPPASHFAALDNVAAVPWIAPSGRGSYSHFLTVPLPRAFVVAPGGQSVATQGGYDPLGRAMALCRANGLACQPYAVDNDVVWQGKH